MCTDVAATASVGGADEEEQCVVAQAGEMELLRSMYSESELTFSVSPSEASDVQPTGFTIHTVIDEARIDVDFRMPAGYPYKEYPTVFVRGNLQGFQNDRINRDLRSWICQQQLGAPLVSEIISWLSENKEKYREDVPELLGRRGDPPLSNQSDQFARFFILSHHLCSPVKRGNIIQMAKELHLCGFSTPGKPAVIIVEGRLQSCEEFWKTVRSWQWKRISLRHSELLSSSDDRRFNEFREIDANFPGTPVGLVKRILVDAKLDDKFSLLYSL